MIHLHKKNNQKGSVLLLSMLIVIGTLASSVSFGTLIIASIQRARLSSFSMEAYYDAESGMEQYLYEIRKKRTDPDNLPNCVLANSDSQRCSKDVTYSSNIIIPFLKEDNTAQVDVFNSDGGTGANVATLTIQCNKSGLWLDISYTPMSISGGDWSIESDQTEHALQPCTGTIDIDQLETGKSYILRLKALYTDADNITITAKNNVGGEEDIASELTLETVGRQETGNIEQKIRVQMPIRSPLSSFYDYVLFSEETIRKIYEESYSNSNSNS